MTFSPVDQNTTNPVLRSHQLCCASLRFVLRFCSTHARMQLPWLMTFNRFPSSSTASSIVHMSTQGSVTWPRSGWNASLAGLLRIVGYVKYAPRLATQATTFLKSTTRLSSATVGLKAEAGANPCPTTPTRLNVSKRFLNSNIKIPSRLHPPFCCTIAISSSRGLRIVHAFRCAVKFSGSSPSVAPRRLLGHPRRLHPLLFPPPPLYP
mmetsp:Transcript_11371/g.17969  ORF Transcript_11371/g.17969 Transcript_11371/m.17969 type:complete len:208 (+) Transcript_11371:88-711(+)